ncbi:hypothetical protein [Chryseobacterium sp. M5A1_1a]
MKTQMRISEKFHHHFLWRLSLLCCVFISSFSLAQVYMGTTLVVVVKGTVVTGFSPEEDNKQIHHNTLKTERRLAFRRKNKKRSKFLWINSESLSFIKKPRACHIVFRFSKVENSYFFNDCGNITNIAIAQNFQPKSKADIEVLSYKEVRLFRQSEDKAVPEIWAEIINRSVPVFFPRPPPIA